MMSPATRERRYRSLLRLYPEPYRQEYGEEMLEVLLADPRRGPGQFLDLFRSAAAVRGRLVLGDLGGRPWRQAAAVIQFLGAAMMLAFALRRVVPVGVLAGPAAVAPLDAIRAAAWALVLAGGLLGRKVLGVSAAGAGLAAEIAAPARFYAETPAVVLNAYWLILTAAALVVAAAVATRADRPRGWIPLTAAGVAVIVGGFGWWGGWVYIDLVRGPLSLSSAGPLIAAAVFLAIAVGGQEPMIRRRVVAAAVPVVSALSLTAFGFGDLVEFNGMHPEAVRKLDAPQWAALVVIPALAFLVAAELNRRLEDTRFRAAATGTSKDA
jgi:hypothetical protein